MASGLNQRQRGPAGMSYSLSPDFPLLAAVSQHSPPTTTTVYRPTTETSNHSSTIHLPPIRKLLPEFVTSVTPTSREKIVLSISQGKEGWKMQPKVKRSDWANVGTVRVQVTELCETRWGTTEAFLSLFPNLRRLTLVGDNLVASLKSLDFSCLQRMDMAEVGFDGLKGTPQDFFGAISWFSSSAAHVALERCTFETDTVGTTSQLPSIHSLSISASSTPENFIHALFTPLPKTSPYSIKFHDISLGQSERCMGCIYAYRRLISPWDRKTMEISIDQLSLPAGNCAAGIIALLQALVGVDLTFSSRDAPEYFKNLCSLKWENIVSQLRQYSDYSRTLIDILRGAESGVWEVFQSSLLRISEEGIYSVQMRLSTTREDPMKRLHLMPTYHAHYYRRTILVDALESYHFSLLSKARRRWYRLNTK